MQIFKILENVEVAPSTQIFTGQIGTTQIPDYMDVVQDDQNPTKDTMDTM